MATELQKKAVTKYVEKRGNKYQALIAAGYDHDTAKNPSQVFESKGVQELLAKGELMGLTDEFTLNHLKRVMENETTSVNALRLWFQTKYPQTKENPNTFIQNNFIVTRGEDESEPNQD